jgi:beta-glucosidase
MTLPEKVKQMSGDTPLFPGLIEMARVYNARPLPAGENLRLGVPGIRFTDGPRGVVMYQSTCFPASIARGASWDPQLEERIGDAIGVEARSHGANFFGGVCINLLRHPAWGRAQETYGEDPHHLGEMGAALVRGVQSHVMACAKHYAANSMENARFHIDVQVDERALHEVYLPHFRRCVEEGVAAIMSAYNRVNGVYCGHHPVLLRRILKETWGFQGFVLSDFVWGVRETLPAVEGGMDIEMPFPRFLGPRLVKLVEKGLVAQAVIDESVQRILRQKLRFAQVGQPDRYGPQAVLSQEHRALAREAATKSMVLLRNEPDPATGAPLLPIDRRRVSRIALIGRLAAIPNTGDQGSSQVRPPYVVTPLEGLLAAAGDDLQVRYVSGRRAAAAVRVARWADLAILVAGYTFREEGEFIPFPRKGGDRALLTLLPRDEMIIQRVVAANPRTVVVLMGGSAIITESWRNRVPAILMAWYPGMEGGHALADLLLGAANPSGKLTSVWPRSAGQLPFFDRNARSIQYGLFHGYRLMNQQGDEPAFPFGFGLNYSRYHYHGLSLTQPEFRPDETVRVGVNVTNQGPMAGEEVLQLYVGYPGSAVERPVRELKAFARVHLEPGETTLVQLEVPVSRLAYYRPEVAGWVVEPLEYQLGVGPSADPRSHLQAQFRVVDAPLRQQGVSWPPTGQA